MKKFWKHFEELGIALRSSVASDLFTAARFKITALYLVMGCIVFAMAGYVAYQHVLSIIGNVIGVIQRALQNQGTLDAATTANLITRAITDEIHKFTLLIGIWILFTTVLFAYLLAGITLWPIQRAMDRKKRFIGNVAHELRTPLSVMKTNCEVALLEPETASREELIETIRTNLEEIDHMSQITQFLLNFSSLEGRVGKLELSPIDVSSIVAKAVDSTKPSSDEKGIILTHAIERPVVIRGNAIAFEQMVLNLLKNAIAYTPPGKSVHVTVSRRTYGGGALQVRDTGIGISAPDLSTIFEPFYRGDNVAGNKKDGNAGLGLALVKEIAELHGGAVSIKSALGKGTSVVVKF
jgi:signal transduction histidine kinase